MPDLDMHDMHCMSTCVHMYPQMHNPTREKRLALLSPFQGNYFYLCLLFLSLAKFDSCIMHWYVFGLFFRSIKAPTHYLLFVAQISFFLFNGNLFYHGRKCILEGTQSLCVSLRFDSLETKSESPNYFSG